MSANTLAPGDRLVDRFVVVRVAASGGMGVVLEAFDTRLERTVAIKLVRRELVQNVDLRQRFEREARAAAAVSHPNVVQVHDLGTTPDGIPFVVTEWVPGRSLFEVRRDEGRLAWPRAVALVEQALRGLASAHAAGVVHRDIKLGNLMLVRQGAAERVKVVDFGLALLKRGDAYVRLTMTGQVLGTPMYMAPEQRRGEDVGPSADLFAMGVVAWCLLTGLQPPAHDPSRAPRADAVDPSIPHALASVVERAMQADPHARFASADEMADALIAAVAPGRVPAPAPSAPSGRARLVLGVAALAALAALVVGGFVVGVVGYERFTREAPPARASGAGRAPLPPRSSPMAPRAPCVRPDGTPEISPACPSPGAPRERAECWAAYDCCHEHADRVRSEDRERCDAPMNGTDCFAMLDDYRARLGALGAGGLEACEIAALPPAAPSEAPPACVSAEQCCAHVRHALSPRLDRVSCDQDLTLREPERSYQCRSIRRVWSRAAREQRLELAPCGVEAPSAPKPPPAGVSPSDGGPRDRSPLSL